MNMKRSEIKNSKIHITQSPTIEMLNKVTESFALKFIQAICADPLGMIDGFNTHYK